MDEGSHKNQRGARSEALFQLPTVCRPLLCFMMMDLVTIVVEWDIVVRQLYIKGKCRIRITKYVQMTPFFQLSVLSSQKRIPRTLPSQHFLTKFTLARLKNSRAADMQQRPAIRLELALFTIYYHHCFRLNFEITKQRSLASPSTLASSTLSLSSYFLAHFIIIIIERRKTISPWALQLLLISRNLLPNPKARVPWVTLVLRKRKNWATCTSAVIVPNSFMAFPVVVARPRTSMISERASFAKCNRVDERLKVRR